MIDYQKKYIKYKIKLANMLNIQDIPTIKPKDVQLESNILDQDLSLKNSNILDRKTNGVYQQVGTGGRTSIIQFIKKFRKNRMTTNLKAKKII